jgi:hypothetical protein
MLLPIGIAVGSHLAGALLGLGGRVRSLGPLRTFALASALAVVLAQLLPDALGAIGLWALVLFVASLALPSLLGKASARLGRANGTIGLELGYAGLVLHKVADGVGLGAYGGHHDGHAHLDVLAALSAHTIPMVAVVAMAYQRRAGWKVAVMRVGGLALAAVLGVYVTAIVPASVFSLLEPWVTACVAGLLLHVLAHDWDVERRPRALGERVIDLIAIAAGGALAWIGGHAHEGGVDLHDEIGASLYALAIQSAPPVFAGLAVAAAAIAIGHRRSVGDVVRGASMGGKHTFGFVGSNGAFAGITFLVASPALALETVLASVQLGGWMFALARVVLALVIGLVTALVARRLVRPLPIRHDVSFSARALEAFDALVHHVVPWLLVGLVAAAYMQASITSTPAREVALVLVAIPSYASAIAATPIAAVMLGEGASAGAVLGGLALGSAIAAAVVVHKAYGARAAIATITIGTIVAAGTTFALPRVYLTPPAMPIDWIAIAAAVPCALVVLRALWRVGLTAWLATLGEAFGAHDHVHEHDHDHETHSVRAPA